MSNYEFANDQFEELTAQLQVEEKIKAGAENLLKVLHMRSRHSR